MNTEQLTLGQYEAIYTTRRQRATLDGARLG